jgi:hypothetical protein
MTRCFTSTEVNQLHAAVLHSASQQIPLLLCKPKAHYRIHDSPSLVSTLSQMNPVHTFPPYLPKIHSNIILPSAPTFYELVSSLQVFRPKFCTYFSSLSCVLHASPSHHPWLVTSTKANEYKMHAFWQLFLTTSEHYQVILAHSKIRNEIHLPNFGKCFLFTIASRTALGPTQPPINGYQGLSPWG